MLRRRPLTYCPNCNTNAVVPIQDECREFDQPYEGWLLSIRCTACFMHREMLVSQAVADAFDIALDSEAAALRRIDLKNMEKSIDQFTKDLHTNAILPEDF